MTCRRALYLWDDNVSDQEAQRKAALVGAENGWELQQMFVQDQWREMPLDDEVEVLAQPAPPLRDPIPAPSALPSRVPTPWETVHGH